MSVLTTRGWYGSLPNSFLVFVSDSRFRALDSLQLFHIHFSYFIHIHFSYFTFTSAKFYIGIVEEKFTSAISHLLQLFHIHFSYFTSTSAKQKGLTICTPNEFGPSMFWDAILSMPYVLFFRRSIFVVWCLNFLGK